LFGIHPVTAVGTDLLHAAVTKSFGTLVHGYIHTVDWRVVRRLATGSVPMTVLTLLILSLFDLSSAHAAHLISRAWGGAAGYGPGADLSRVPARLFWQPLPRAGPSTRGRPDGRPRRRSGRARFVSSVGAGAIGVTALIILYPRLSTPRIVGSDIAHAVPLTLVAGTGHWIIGSVDTVILGSLLTGSIPGIVVCFFLGVAIAPLWTATMDIAPNYAGSSSALMNAAGAVAGIVSPVAFGWILDRTGSWTTPFAFSVGLLLFAIVMTYWIRPDRPIEAVPGVGSLAVAGE